VILQPGDKCHVVQSVIAAASLPRSRSGRGQHCSSRRPPSYNPAHDFKEPESISQWAGNQSLRQDAARSEAERVGRVYGAQIRSSLEQAKLAFDLARYEASRHQRSFYVGHSPYIHGNLLSVLEQLTLPGSEGPPIALKSATTTRLVWRVLRGELQAGFGVLPIVDKALWIERVAHEPFCVCIAEHHRLATHSRLAARELSNETLVWIPRNIHRLFYDQIADYLRTLKFNLRRFQEANTITQALDFAAHGVGVAFVPQSASRFQRPGALFKPLTDDLLRIETALFVRRDQMRSSVKDFIAVALSGIAALKLNPLEKR
jgi:LysR family transcriptional regulator, benzoate and cis,cis-muconate-responsive activator of ben and cat genes